MSTSTLNTCAQSPGAGPFTAHWLHEDRPLPPRGQDFPLWGGPCQPTPQGLELVRQLHPGAQQGGGRY